MKKRQIMAFALCAVMVLGLAGCKKDGGIQDASGGQSESQPAGSTAPDKPDGFVDNGTGIDEIDEAYLFESDLDAGITLGRRDSSVYCAGEPMGLMFATNLITADPDGDASEGFPLARIWNRVDHVRFGSHEYKLDELVRPRDQGFQVLEMLAADFGVVQYKQDPETGSLEGAAKLGSLSGDALREAYSERSDQDGYTVCVYYLDAAMNGMPEEDYTACRTKLKEAYGTDTDQYLDGTLAVMLYYDTEGYDMYYNIAAIAPTYWESVDDFAKNMDSAVRHDTTNCHMVVDGDVKIGFVNQVFIRCDKDSVPDGIWTPDTDDSRIEDGAIDGADKTPGPSGEGTDDTNGGE